MQLLDKDVCKWSLIFDRANHRFYRILNLVGLVLRPRREFVEAIGIWDIEICGISLFLKKF